VKEVCRRAKRKEEEKRREDRARKRKDKGREYLGLKEKVIRDREGEGKKGEEKQRKR
jgi:hypothetical protein